MKIFLFLLLIVGWAESNTQKTNLRFPFDLPKGYGPWIRPTVGQIWPQPQLQQSTNNFMVLRPSNFEFQVICVDGRKLKFKSKNLLQTCADYRENLWYPRRSYSPIPKFNFLSSERKWDGQAIFETIEKVQSHMGTEWKFPRLSRHCYSPSDAAMRKFTFARHGWAL